MRSGDIKILQVKSKVPVLVVLSTRLEVRVLSENVHAGRQYFTDITFCVKPPVLISAPGPKAQVHYCDHALSVACPSSLTFHIVDFSSETIERNSTKLDRKQYQVCVFWGRSENKMATMASDWLRHFRLLLWNCWTEFNATWQEARSQCHLPSLCFLVDRKNKMAALASDLLRHFRLLLWNRWMEFNETWHEARSKRALPFLCFSGRSEKQDGPAGVWLAQTFSTSLKTLNGIQWNLIGSNISTSSTKFVFFGPIGKTRWPLCPIS